MSGVSGETQGNLFPIDFSLLSILSLIFVSFVFNILFSKEKQIYLNLVKRVFQLYPPKIKKG